MIITWVGSDGSAGNASYDDDNYGNDNDNDNDNDDDKDDDDDVDDGDNVWR